MEDYVSTHLLDASQMANECVALRKEGKSIVFTNGAFDLLHLGHLTYLAKAREQGDLLIVGMNSDESVTRYKGSTRPIVPQYERARMLLGLKPVDYVVIFDEDEPKELIAKLLPEVLVKGKDWAHYVSGQDIVEANGGRVYLADMVEGRSTTNIIERIQAVLQQEAE